MKIHQFRSRSGFTLIELMAVITITVILAALIVAGVGHASRKQASEKARLQLAQLTQGLENYRRDMSTYPVSANTADGLGQSARCLYQALFQEGYEYSTLPTPPANWTKATSIYVPELDPTSSKLGWVTPVTGPDALPPTSTIVMDPWGKEYRYRSAKNASGAPNPSTINPEFDLWTSGQDTNSVPASPSNPANRDDLRNFSPPPAPSNPVPAAAAPQPIANILAP